MSQRLDKSFMASWTFFSEEVKYKETNGENFNRFIPSELSDHIL